MADEPPANLFLNTTPFGPQMGSEPTSTAPAPPENLFLNPLTTPYDRVPSKEHGPGIVGKAFEAVRANLAENYRTAGQPVTPPDQPVESPFLTAVAHGGRNAIDYAAEKLARGGEAVLGDTAKSLPGYRSADDIRADLLKRQEAYKSNPDNEAGGWPATIGSGVGTGLVYGGPLARIGGAATSLLTRAGATTLPGVARALEYLGGGATAAPGATVPARLATRAASLGAQGAELGGTTAALESDPAKPFWPQVGEGALTGAVAGPAAGSAIFATAYPLRAALGMVPNMVRPDIAPLADRFVNQYGIHLDPSQLTTNPTYKLMTDQAGKLPLSGAGNRIAESRLQWQQALSREMGEEAPHGVTHDVMDRAATRIGTGMDAIAGRTTIQGGPALASDFTNIAMDIPRFGLTPEQLPPIRAQLRNVLDAFQAGNGRISGETYQNLTQRGGPLDSVISSNDPTVSAFGMRIRHALDDAFQRSAVPGDRDALQNLRYQYRVMKTVQPMVEQKGLTGDIEPNGLLQRVRAQSAKYDPSTGGLAYTGGGTLGDLAYGGQIFFGKPADSGTAARNLVTGALLGGGGVGALTHPVAAAGTLGGLLANRALQAGLRSPAVGSSMIENSINPRIGPTMQRQLPQIVPGLLGQ